MLGTPVPDYIKNKPELLPWLAVYLQAFNELDSERSHAMGFTKIPWSSIIRYAEHHNFSPEMTENLVLYVREMDNANIDFLAKNKKAPRHEPV